MINEKILNSAMNICIGLAKKNSNKEQYPIAAAIVDRKGNILATSSSSLRQKYDPTNHPEIAAIRTASEMLHSRFLTECYLITTLEPCPMCTSAAIWAKMQGIAFGAFQEDAISFVATHSSQLSWRQINVKASEIVKKGQPMLEIYEGVLREKCQELFR